MCLNMVLYMIRNINLHVGLLMPKMWNLAAMISVHNVFMFMKCVYGMVHCTLNVWRCAFVSK